MDAVSLGRTKPGQHYMSLALAMKSLTGSRRVIDSLIRLLAFQPIHIGISGLLATVNFQNISLLNEYQMWWTSHFFGLICKATSAMLLSVGLQLHGIHLEATRIYIISSFINCYLWVCSFRLCFIYDWFCYWNILVTYTNIIKLSSSKPALLSGSSGSSK